MDSREKRKIDLETVIIDKVLRAFAIKGGGGKTGWQLEEEMSLKGSSWGFFPLFLR